ncbi:MAG: hypothetical protein ABS76_01980 [Pelagibacterium sp. SCN 64-44]|nr:MAG: hypothetical protein ABS76_01980 [Pelagibacterium sp. SCN 64-44]
MSEIKLFDLYIGNRRKGPSSWQKSAERDFGITHAHFHGESGEIASAGVFAPDISVGALIHDAGRDVVYALDEALTLPGRHLGGGGQVVAFRRDPATGQLEEFSRSPSFGTLPAYAALDASGEFLVVVHHTGHTPITRTRRRADGEIAIEVEFDEAGTVLFPLAPDGALMPPCDIFRHRGAGALPAQSHPQLHGIARAPGSDFFVVCDKGADRIHFFGLDRRGRKLLYRDDMTIAAPAGSSPRYCVFHPSLPIFYVNFETAPLIQAYRYDAAGAVEHIQSLAPLPEAAAQSVKIMQSDLCIHPNGQRLYSLIRGSESVAGLEIAPHDGTLRPVQHMALGVENARGAAISPDGRHFAVAALVSRDVSVWAMDEDGNILPQPRRYPQHHPGCLLFVPR